MYQRIIREILSCSIGFLSPVIPPIGLLVGGVDGAVVDGMDCAVVDGMDCAVARDAINRVCLNGAISTNGANGAN